MTNDALETLLLLSSANPRRISPQSLMNIHKIVVGFIFSFSLFRSSMLIKKSIFNDFHGEELKADKRL
jgi:hypothetical protein